MSTSRQDTARQELLRRRLQALKLADDTSSSRAIRPRDDPHRAPLSFAQRRMWLHQQVNPDSSAYNVSIQLTFEGSVDRRALESALAGVAQRQELLRTTYHTDDEGHPYQQIHTSLPPPVRWLETTGEEIDEPAAAEAAVPFDLARGGPIRFLLAKASDELFFLVVTVHHIIWDGLSFAALSADLTALYEQALHGSEPTLRPLPVQYADFAVWEQRNWSEAAHQETLDHWRRRFTPLPARPPLLTARPGEAGDGERAGRVDRRMPDAAAQGLRKLASEHATTVFTVYLACQLLVLHRYTGATDLTLGTTAMNRDTSGVEGLVGNFGNTLALRFDLDGDPDFGELLTRVRGTCETAYQHQGYPYDLLVERLRPPGEPDRPVLFDSLALFLSQEVSGPRLPGTKARWQTVFTGATAFPLAIQGFLTDEGLDVEATYAAALFDQRTVSDMVDLVGETITRAARQPRARVSKLIDPTESERAPLLARGAGERTDAPPALLDDFTQRTVLHPEATALICGGQQYSYRWLRDRARALTARLKALGAAPESTVALVLPRSPDLVAAVLAVLGAGAAYVPVDPAYPADRVRFMLTDSAPTAVLTTASLAADLPDGTAPLLLLDDLDATGTVAATASDETWPRPSPPEAAAWIGYTSGSTGRPKAVVNSRGALASRIQWAGHLWPLDEGEARLAKSSLTFIDGTTEILETLSAGGILLLADDTESRDGQVLTQLIASHGVRHMMAVPSLLRGIAGTPGAFDGMTRVVSTGEPLSAKLAAELSAAVPPGALTNSYGCSELAGDVVAGAVPGTANTAVPIGRPVPNTSAYVLDDRLRLAPDGVIGELYIGGAQLARGYRGQPVLTAERFVAHPFARGERLYRTGDLARWHGTELELLGRRDDQVKIRGQRVELGELAAVARAAPGVGDAVVITRPGPGDSLQLVLYVTPRSAGQEAPPSHDSRALRAHLERALPAALLPSAIVPLPVLPLLPNGKVNRLALPVPAADVPATHRAPSTPAERALCAVVDQVLERDGSTCGPDDDFFALGGDSITAISFVAKATRAGFPFSVPDVFEHRTVAGLLDVAHSGTGSVTTPVALPIAAHRLRRSGATAGEYVTSSWWRPGTAVTLPDLERALRSAASRHEALRLVLDTRRKTLWRASIRSAPGEGPLASIASGSLDEAVAVARAQVDVARGQVLHAVLAPGPTIVLAAHALAVDDTSLDLLRLEISAFLAGEEPKGEGTHWPRPPDATPGPWAEPLRQATALWPQPGEPGTTRTHLWLRTRSSRSEHETVGAWLHALRRWLDTEVAVTDRLLRPAPTDAIGPHSRRHPVHATAGDTVATLADRDRALAATAGGYEPYRYTTTAGRRAFTGLPEANTLIRPGVEPTEGERFTDTVRGLERFYSFVACFDGRGGVGLAADPAALSAADGLLHDWVTSLEG
ncbi:amino acid adenylation domain-containing protein [Streptomyces sp. NPDC005953]|uniref:non-ribosomal peptide synthetase n=1 Tax=Streptomyces sp. NPDC005953 TaxID=3156719 RepID=UPI0034101B57